MVNIHQIRIPHKHNLWQNDILWKRNRCDLNNQICWPMIETAHGMYRLNRLYQAHNLCAMPKFGQYGNGCLSVLMNFTQKLTPIYIFLVDGKFEYLTKHLNHKNTLKFYPFSLSLSVSISSQHRHIPFTASAFP